jgi:molybdopterin/thiamine biosynthesis adenylyltransferase
MDETLSQTEIERYARHLVIRDIGGPGQQKLKAAHVAVIGAGGLGAPCFSIWRRRASGMLTIIDDDSVALSNLQRQIIHSDSPCWRSQGGERSRALEGINPHVALASNMKRVCRPTMPQNC